MTTLDELPPLRDTIARHDLGARKALGQHFLLDLNITRKIAALTGAGPDDHIIEIGPGPGGLTRALLETGAQVTAIERDPRVAPVMAELSDATGGRLTMVEADALGVREVEAAPGARIIASNLPYNISTELLVKWLLARPRFWDRMVLMFQREVGERILSEHGTKAYGRLSVLSQAASAPRLGFHLPARAFTPPPKVESSVLVFERRDDDLERLGRLERVTRAAFGQRRKMIRASLRPLFGERLEDILHAADLAPTQRAENLTPADFLILSDALGQN